MRRIVIPWPDPAEVPGRSAVVPVLVDWFPPLTDDELVQNALATLAGRKPPHPNPNLIHVELER